MSVKVAATFLVPAGAVHEVTMQLLDRGGQAKDVVVAVADDAVGGSKIVVVATTTTTAVVAAVCWNQARRDDDNDDDDDVECVVGSTPKAKVLPQRRAADVVNNETCSFMMEIPFVPSLSSSRR
jgi:hypothetical protein